MFPHKEAFTTIGNTSHLAQSAVPIITENQWLSQATYQNVDTNTVDWAAIAQQWIHMKESFGSVANDEKFPIAPPPPRISQPNTFYEEQGEAPMEVEHDDEPQNTSQTNSIPMTAPPPPTNVFQTNNNWSNNTESNRSKSHQKPWNNKKGNRWGSLNQSKGHRNDNYASGQVFNQKQANNSWSNDSSSVQTNAFPFGNHSNNSKLQATDTNAITKSGIQVDQVGLNATPSLDAAQRKTLPAWIREGLEKMEREKLKQAERDREMKERDEKRRQEKLLEQNVLMQFNTNDSTPMLPVKSKFESESESDNDETVSRDFTENVTRNSKATSIVTSTVGNSASGTSSEATATTIKPHRSRADILTEIMLSVRKNLTEILLEVTNEEIHAIAYETISKMRTKGRKAQTVQKNALTAITPALGLVTYDDSDASKSGDESDEYGSGRQQNSDNDSEIELKRAIHRRKQCFESKSAEIERYLAQNEEREKQWLEQENESDKYDETIHSNVPTSSVQTNSFDNATSTHQYDVTKSQNSASKSERKGSRFSDAKGLLYNVSSSQIPMNVPSVSQYIRPASVEKKPTKTDVKKHESKHDRSDSDSDSSRKKSSKSSRHRNKRHASRSPSSRKHKHSSRRRSSSSSSDRSSYSRQSKSSQSSHKRDKYSRENSYSRSHSHKSSRRSRSRSRSRDSRESHSSRRRR